MSMIATRTMGLAAAGVLTIAFAVGNLFRTIGFWGVRNYQVSDQNGEYSFQGYLRARFVSMGFMLLIGILYSVYLRFGRAYPVEKLLVVFVTIAIYVVESFEDVIWGEFQRQGRLDIGAKLFLSRWGSLLFGYLILAYGGAGQVTAITGGALFSCILPGVLLFVHYGMPKYIKESVAGDWREILCKTFPLFVVSFLTFFVNNIAKYSMDLYYDETLQAVFGFIAMPVFAVELLSSFVYQPKLVLLTRLWNDGKQKTLVRELLIQTGIILILTILCLAGGYIAGIPVLSALYSTDLCLYRGELMIMLVGAGVMALAGYACVILTILRRQKDLLMVYIFGTVAALLVIPSMVKARGVYGAAMGNLIALLALAVASWGILIVRLARNKGERQGERDV